MPVDPRIQALLDAKLQTGPSITELKKQKKGARPTSRPPHISGRGKFS